MKLLIAIAAIILAAIGSIGCCSGSSIERDQNCQVCEQECMTADQFILQASQAYLGDMARPTAGELTKPSQAYWAWDCFKTCLQMKAPSSKRGKIANALANTCINKGCKKCASSGVTDWPSCSACVGCVSTKVGYNIGYAAICAQECLKNR